MGAPKAPEEMLAGRAAIAEWGRLTYGWLGRAPNYKAAFLTMLGDDEPTIHCRKSFHVRSENAVCAC